MNEMQKRMRREHCCVIIPTYNNRRTVRDVIQSAKRYCSDVFVVNDGATDGTAEILKHIKGITLVTLPVNAGKGGALLAGMRAAYAAGFAAAITMDSDGQHLAEDIPRFMDCVERNPGAFIMGARNMTAAGAPRKSSFGMKFSNFWFAVETGVRLPDTQSGFRLYPLAAVLDKRYLTGKFEFEIEVMVRLAWNGIPILHVPVSVVYQQGEARVSHFRPLRDFTRISVLNTALVTIAFLWIKPRDFVRALTPANITRFIKRNILLQGEPPLRAAFSVAFGLFMGIAPIWGYQLIVGIALASLLRLNRVLVVAAAHISIPPMIPPIIYASFMAGSLLTGRRTTAFSPEHFSLDAVRADLFQYVVGSLILGVGAALAGFVITLIWIRVLAATTLIVTRKR